MWVNDEVQVDRFHKKDDQLYQLMEHRVQAQGILTSHSTSALLAETLAEEIPEVEYAASVVGAGHATLTRDGEDIKAIGRFAGQDYFHIFSYELLHGDKSGVLSDKNGIVISESLALKLFKTTDDILGKPLKYQQESDYFVSGIFKDIPSQASENFDFILSYEVLKEIRGEGVAWSNSGPNTFVILKKGADVSVFNHKIKDYVKVKTNNEVMHRTLFAELYSKNYLYNKYENGVQEGGRIEYVRLFSMVAIFIILIACINFMNLSTAKATRRLKEVGIKKAIGASRKTLVYNI